MLSRRDKLLQEPWRERRYRDHRSKVKLALPAIDDAAPPARPHVAVKLKKCQREVDRAVKIQSDNFSLLQRLNAIMKVNRLDNHWRKPLPNFHHKVGLYFETGTVDQRVWSEDTEDSYVNYKCYACEVRKRMTGNPDKEDGRTNSLPSIY